MSSALPPSLPLEKPKTLVVFGIIDLAFAAFGFFGLISSLLILIAPQMQAQNPVIPILQQDAVYAAYFKGLLGLSVLLVPLQIMAAIGLIKGREWARKLTLILAAVSIVIVAVNGWITHHHVTGPMIANMKTSGGDSTQMPIMEGVMMFSLILGIAWAVIWATLKTIFLTRPRVVAYCKASARKA